MAEITPPEREEICVQCGHELSYHYNFFGDGLPCQANRNECGCLAAMSLL